VLLKFFRTAKKTSVWKKGQSGHPESKWKPGQSGNPGGRPKIKLLSEAYKKILETEITSGPNKGKTYAEAIAEKIADESVKGKVNAAGEIADRVEGKPRQAYEVQLSVTDELPKLIEEGRRRAAARKPRE
jgi:Family of unknown function (DUF5681)